MSLRSIPSVEKLLGSPPFGPLVARWGRGEVKREITAQLDAFRRDPSSLTADYEAIAALVSGRLGRAFEPSLRPVINATGILIHTNLGRSPLDGAMLERARPVLAGYSNLELDLEDGKRGRRDEHLAAVARRLFGCEAALLVNNNAAAVLLLLAANARGRDVVVSRGELVEIGGSFRVPDVIVQGGAVLREVGTTNRTRARDFAAAAGEATAAMLRVHRSNFEIVGFTESPSMEEMVEVARGADVPLFYDEGSGRVVDLERYGFSKGETLRALIAMGVDAVTCSTDKLIGATQGGLILGRAAIVAACAAHPLMRALRAGKESYAIVGETLAAFATEQHEARVPIYRMLATPLEALATRARAVAEATAGRAVDTRAALGGGTTPAETIPSAGVTVASGPDAERRRKALLEAARPVIGRIERDELILDLRSVDPADDAALVEAVRAAR